MGLKIDPDEARKRIDEFINQIDDLLDKGYREGKDEKRRMSTKLDNFAEVAFSDGESKKGNLYSGSLVWGKRDPRQKQKDYEKSLKRKRRELEAWKQQIELEENSDLEDISENKDHSRIKKEISKLDDELPLYANELEKSLEELQSDHFLASTLIAGRVIDYTIDQIKSSQQLGDPEEVLEYLEQDGIIDSREGKITDSIKSYRDVYTHEVGKVPDFNETMIILLGCAKLLHNIQDSGKARKYDLA